MSGHNWSRDYLSITLNCFYYQVIFKLLNFLKFANVIGQKTKVGCQCVYPNGHLLFCNKMQNFETLLKQSFRFLQQNTKFWKLHPNDHSFFTTKYRILKVEPKRPFVFPTKKSKSNNYLSSIYFKFRFLKTEKKINKNMISRYPVLFFYNENQT